MQWALGNMDHDGQRQDSGLLLFDHSRMEALSSSPSGSSDSSLTSVEEEPLQQGFSALLSRGRRNSKVHEICAASLAFVSIVTLAAASIWAHNSNSNQAIRQMTERRGLQPLVLSDDPPASPPGPKLFCFSVMMLGGEEERLLKTQLMKRCSIFQCEESAILSSERYKLGSAEWGDVWTWKTNAAAVVKGKYGKHGQKTDSFLNTPQFILAWDVLIESKRIWNFDFIVKVDPDAVFLADRLRKEVKAYSGQAVYFTNCGKWASGNKLYGSLEVFSKEAIHAYSEKVDDCKALPWKGKWGEDYYMQQCMDKVLKVRAVHSDNLVADKRCVWAKCTDWRKVAFHPFKEVVTYFDCWGQATQM